MSEGIFQGQFFYTQVTGIELDGFSSGCQACVGSAFTHRAILWSNLWVGVSFSMVVFYLREWSFKIKKLFTFYNYHTRADYLVTLYLSTYEQHQHIPDPPYYYKPLQTPIVFSAHILNIHSSFPNKHKNDI